MNKTLFDYHKNVPSPIYIDICSCEYWDNGNFLTKDWEDADDFLTDFLTDYDIEEIECFKKNMPPTTHGKILPIKENCDIISKDKIGDGLIWENPNLG